MPREVADPVACPYLMNSRPDKPHKAVLLFHDLHHLVSPTSKTGDEHHSLTGLSFKFYSSCGSAFLGRDKGELRISRTLIKNLTAILEPNEFGGIGPDPDVNLCSPWALTTGKSTLCGPRCNLTWPTPQFSFEILVWIKPNMDRWFRIWWVSCHIRLIWNRFERGSNGFLF